MEKYPIRKLSNTFHSKSQATIPNNPINPNTPKTPNRRISFGVSTIDISHLNDLLGKSRDPFETLNQIMEEIVNQNDITIFADSNHKDPKYVELIFVLLERILRKKQNNFCVIAEALIAGIPANKNSDAVSYFYRNLGEKYDIKFEGLETSLNARTSNETFLLKQYLIEAIHSGNMKKLKKGAGALFARLNHIENTYPDAYRDEKMTLNHALRESNLHKKSVIVRLIHPDNTNAEKNLAGLIRILEAGDFVECMADTRQNINFSFADVIANAAKFYDKIIVFTGANHCAKFGPNCEPSIEEFLQQKGFVSVGTVFDNDSNEFTYERIWCQEPYNSVSDKEYMIFPRQYLFAALENHAKSAEYAEFKNQRPPLPEPTFSLSNPHPPPEKNNCVIS